MRFILTITFALIIVAIPGKLASAQGCTEVRERAKAIAGLLAPPDGTQPLLRRWRGVRELAPAGDRGKTVHLTMRVDENGKPISSTIKISGIFDVRLASSLRRVAENSQFTPATMSGCNVEGAFEGSIRILPSGGVNTLEWRRPQRAVSGDEAPAARLGEECAPQRDYARGRALSQLTDRAYKPPAPLKMFFPPLPVPSNVRGNTVEFKTVIDSAGNIVRDSASLAGIANNAYAKQVYEQLLKMTFRPATLEGCAVESRFMLKMQL